MIGLLPIDEKEQKALLAGLESLDDIIVDIYGNESEKPAYTKFKDILEPLKDKLLKLKFKL